MRHFFDFHFILYACKVKKKKMTMAHIRSISSLLTGGYPSHGNNQNNVPNNDDIVKKGYLAKRKNMKSRFFVLRRETKEFPATLECYDSEKKFLDGYQPKKKYILKDCFSIIRKTDKNNCVIALYINKDCIGLVTRNEEELQDWLQALQYHKNPDPEHIESTGNDYEHVWQVEVLPRSLARKEGLTGLHFLCLTRRFISLVRVNDRSVKKEFQFSTIKKCGFYDQFFFLILGRFSCIGCGEIYMKTEDSFIAQCIHNSVGSAMNSFRGRTRSDPGSNVATSHGKESKREHNPPLDLNEPFSSLLSEIPGIGVDDSRPKTPEDENEFGYMAMGVNVLEFIPPIIKSKGLSGDPKLPSDDGGYMNMELGSGGRQPPNSLRVSPRIISTSNSSGGISSPGSGSTSHSQGSSTPVSPSVGGSLIWGTGGSPQAAYGVYDSRNVSLPTDAYVPMISPGNGTQGPQISQPSFLESAARPYVEMGPLPGTTIAAGERIRTISTPTPIPFSPSDEESCYEMFCNSGSSSSTSGTPSDLRIHDIGGDERVQTPYGGTCGSGLTPNYCTMDEPDSMACPRSIRTNSVGSKTDNFKRKNSAPMLTASIISHSWSGPTGSYLKNIVQEPNKMEMDFSKNKSCDVIPSDDKEKERKLAKDRLFPTFTGNRHRTNSKSFGSSNSKLGSDMWGIKDKRTSETEYCSRGVEIPYARNGMGDVLELSFSSSPRNSNSDPLKRYLNMEIIGKRGPRTSSLNDACSEISSSLSSCASQDDYVPMMREGSSGTLTIASSSSSCSSISTAPTTVRTRRSSSIYAPVAVSQELPSPSEDLVIMDEELESWMADEWKKKSKKNTKRKSLKDSTKKKKPEGGSTGGDSPEVPSKSKSQGPLAALTNLITRKPNTNNNSNLKAPLSPKGSPLPPKIGKESSSPFSSLKRTKSKDKDSPRDLLEERDSISLAGDICSPQGTQTSSPTSVSPQNSLRRRTLGGFDTSPPPPFLVPKGEEKMLYNPLEGRFLRQKSRESDTEASSLKRRSAHPSLEETSSGSLPSLNTIQKTTAKPPPSTATNSDNRNYVNMQPGTSSPQLSPPPTDESSPKFSFKEPQTQVAPQLTKPAPEDNYMMMDGCEDLKETRVPALPSAVTKRPEIPQTLLCSHSHSPPISLEKLSLKEKSVSVGVVGPGSERSRSHSGPGAPEGVKTHNKKSDDGRAASACSSPVSYSPPTSPTLGSVSSMSSLSEGGLSSASSTCTVVNVGVKNAAAAAAATCLGNSLPPPTISPKSLSSVSTRTEGPTSVTSKESQSQGATSTSIKTEDESLNYVALDLGSANSSKSCNSSCSSSSNSNNNNNSSSSSKNNKTSSPKLTQKSENSSHSSGEDGTSLSYVEIDFNKSEGLRNTSLARETKRPH